MRAYKVFAIENGTVVDHIRSGMAVKLIQLLNLMSGNSIVSMGTRFPSKKMGKKDILKIENRELTPEEINQICLIAPEASINIIRNSEVHKKFTVEMPKTLAKVAKCPNPKCITNNEATATKFNLLPGKEKFFACHYCEKQFTPSELAEKILA